ncbi:hypothetical protein NTP67_21585 (plasmid) [Providencia rettgeri]|uniref:hypothetical protein n=1 Tax=Providencia TaxID=586 RepID=UPI00221EB274|nr:hypothetical protein [Providencia sp. PROV077]MBZ3683371.1 hypothetical protein [Providencia rettgeri]UYV43849.1 hypothetical protein NTP67_21585 [Providencia rettgeri]
MIACDQDLLHEIQLVNDIFLENKLNETREDVRLTYIDTKFNPFWMAVRLQLSIFQHAAIL